LNRNINDPVFQEMAGNDFNINISPEAPLTPSTVPNRP